MAPPKCVYVSLLVLLCLKHCTAHRVLAEINGDPKPRGPKETILASWESGSGSGYGSGSGGSGYVSDSGSGLVSGSGGGFGSRSGGASGSAPGGGSWTGPGTGSGGGFGSGNGDGTGKGSGGEGCTMGPILGWGCVNGPNAGSGWGCPIGLPVPIHGPGGTEPSNEAGVDVINKIISCISPHLNDGSVNGAAQEPAKSNGEPMPPSN